MAKQLNDKLKLALQRSFQLSTLVAQQRPEIPPTRDEVGHIGVTKKELQALERLGLIQTTHMNVTEKLPNGSSTTTGRVVFRMTAVGHEVSQQLGFKPWVVPKPEAAPIAAPTAQPEIATPST